MSIAEEFALAFNRRDVDGIVGCFTEDATYDDLFYGHFSGHAGLRSLFDRMFAEGRDHVWTLDLVVESPASTVAEWTFSFVVSEAVPRSAGRELRFRGVSVFDLRDGRCCAYREYFDKGATLVQLGFHPDSLMRVLSRPAVGVG